jgi:predicted RNA-binding Zn-ribbon protein involved in translation (DUF1610 family)
MVNIALDNMRNQLGEKEGVFKVMKRDDVKRCAAYTIDLTKIDGDGAFPCPKCGTIISPEDESEEVYRVVETKFKDDELIELILVCGTCRSTIRLTGFLSLESLPREY